VLDQVKDENLSVYTVWVPILSSDAESSIPDSQARMPDRRVSHHWDGETELVEAYKPILPTHQERTGKYLKAWDVYLLFPFDAEWKDKPPAPSYWMHQLPLDPGRCLNGDTLALEVRNLLKMMYEKIWIESNCIV
jgi:hypothetical protein